MSHPIQIVTIVENTASGRGTLGEHGLSFCLETGSLKLLFDTGQTTRVLLHNAKLLGVDLSDVDAIVLSHGHYDHTGGLAGPLATAAPRVFAHPAAMETRFSRHADFSVREIGIHKDASIALRRAATIVSTESPTEVGHGIFVTGPPPRVTDYEDPGGDFYLDPACTTADPVPDDQSLYFTTQSGVVVLLGCAHAGIVNTLLHVGALTGGAPIHAVIGGTHLGTASPERLDRTVSDLHRIGIDLIAPAHCTGPAASARLWSEFPSAWTPCRVGTTFEFDSGEPP